MASKGQSLTLQYVAWDTENNIGKTGDASNHTLRWVKDGTSGELDGSPTITEVDATNCKGIYKVTLSSSDCTCNLGTLCGVSSTASVVIIPVTISFENLPTVAAGSGAGLAIVGSKMDLVDIPNSIAVEAIQDGLATTSDVDGVKTYGDTKWLTATGFSTPSDLTSLQGHGDSNWSTATGFSTFNPASDKVVLAATQSEYAPAKAGDAMTLTSTYDAAKGNAGDNKTATGFATPSDLTALQSHGDSNWSTATGFLTGSVQDIVDGVWDASVIDHLTNGTTGEALARIQDKTNLISSGYVDIVSPISESGQEIVLVRGDSYQDTSPRGALVFKPKSDDDWPDLTDATAVFTVRLAKDDSVELTTPANILNPDGPDKRISVELSDEQTQALSSSATKNDHKFDIQITTQAGFVWTPIHGGGRFDFGGLTVIQDQTRL